MSLIKKFREMYHNAEISTKITWTYTACFLFLLLIINAVVYFGTFYVLYHPAELTIRYSMEQVKDVLEKLEKDVDSFNPNTIRDPLVAGVVLRVVDDEGNVFIDTDPHYLSIENFERYKTDSTSIFAASDMEVSAIEDTALVYRAKMDYVHADSHVTMYFFRTITSERRLLLYLERFLLILDILGTIFAVALGNWAIRRVLRPIKTMTERAKNITFGRLDGRIPIPPSNDEITELAATFNEMLDRLQGGISKQQKFVSDASHELRTPATVIAGYVEVLETYGMNDKELLDESIEAIRSEAQNMQNLLENLLFLARADQHRQKLKKEKFDLSDIVGDVMKKMKKVTETHKVELLQNESAQIFADKTTVRQMLRIFLDNAVKYTPKGGNIKVSSVLCDGKINLSIADSGIGIESENKNKIFDRFFRVDKEELVSEVGGSGLGLSIAKWIADHHNIAIAVDSIPRKGTIFTLTIPTV